MSFLWFILYLSTYIFIGLSLTAVFLRMSKEPIFKDETAQLMIILAWPMIIVLTIWYGFTMFLSRGK